MSFLVLHCPVLCYLTLSYCVLCCPVLTIEQPTLLFPPSRLFLTCILLFHCFILIIGRLCSLTEEPHATTPTYPLPPLPHHTSHYSFPLLLHYLLKDDCSLTEEPHATTPHFYTTPHYPTTPLTFNSHYSLSVEG